jgi:hypothetical protein
MDGWRERERERERERWGYGNKQSDHSQLPACLGSPIRLGLISDLDAQYRVQTDALMRARL